MRKFLLFLFIGMMALAIVPQGALATALPVANPSFEADTPDNNWVYWPDASSPRRLQGQITGWTLSAPTQQGVHRFTAAEFSSIPDGLNVAYVNTGYISQIITGKSVIAGHIYTLEAMAGKRLDQATRTISYALELLAGGNQLAYLQDTVDTPGTFELASLVYPATQNLAGDLEIRLWSFGGQSSFDAVSLSNATPPPAPIPGSVALMLTGLVGMSALGLRLRKN